MLFNEHGMIEFLKAVDISYMNIDKIVKIKPQAVNLYVSEKTENEYVTKPSPGQGLN